jgi:hypothetical protein
MLKVETTVGLVAGARCVGRKSKRSVIEGVEETVLGGDQSAIRCHCGLDGYFFWKVKGW